MQNQPLTPDVVLSRDYDAANRLASLAVDIGANHDFKNEYTYDNANRLERITQAGQTGGNAVAEKRFDFTYNDTNQYESVTRYASLDTSELVASTDYLYDAGIGWLTSLQHDKSSTPIAGYEYDYDLAGRIEAIDSLLDGMTSYAHDDRGQLTGANHASATDETYEYDENGNRLAFTIGANNRIESDGTYDYEYDDEGNMIAKEHSSTHVREEYEWDYRNRLVKVTFKNALGTPTKIVEQTYDLFNRWVRSQVDTDGDLDVDSQRFFAYDGTQIILEFDGPADSDLTHRYLWGQLVDELLADETVTSLGSAGSVIWPLSDHLGTTRDLLTYNASTDTTTLANHRFFDSFGNLVSQTNGSLTILFGFTGRPLDTATGLQYNLHRWYVSALGVWMSEDPIGFAAGDANVRRVVRNAVLSSTDPTGLRPQLKERADGSKYIVVYGYAQDSWLSSRTELGIVEFDHNRVDEDVAMARAEELERGGKYFNLERIPNPAAALPPQPVAPPPAPPAKPTAKPGKFSNSGLAWIYWALGGLTGGEKVRNALRDEFGLSANSFDALPCDRQFYNNLRNAPGGEWAQVAFGEMVEEGETLEGLKKIGINAAVTTVFASTFYLISRLRSASKAAKAADAFSDAQAAVRNPAWRQSAPDSGILSRNLGIVSGSGQAAHHIVPGRVKRAAPSRALLDYYQIDMNCAENGVALVGGRGAPQNVLPRHHRGSSLHSNVGIDALNIRLRRAVDGIDDWAKGRQALLAELAEIRARIIDGTFPP